MKKDYNDIFGIFGKIDKIIKESMHKITTTPPFYPEGNRRSPLFEPKSDEDGYRIGQGFDVHAFSSQPGPLMLGGVAVDYPYCFEAHSDGDVLLHAICDALLGALALGDIGKHFPDTDPSYENIDSLKLLTATYQLVKQQGYQLVNIDSTIIAQEPKIAPYILEMQTTIADSLGVEVSQISVKATTSEKLGFTGRGEGIAAEAICLLIKESDEAVF